ncbi:MAG: hypothetical protein QM489_03625 [Candidatus Izemoplasma sp.]
MKYENTLKKLEENELTVQETYDLLFNANVKKVKPGKRANFIKLRLNVPEEGKGINRLLKIIFLIPFPMFLATLGLRIGRRFIKDDSIDLKTLIRFIKYSRGTSVQIDSKDAQIDIKII